MIKKKQFLNHLINPSGISLIQVIGTAALVASVGVYVMRLMESTSRLAKTSSLKLQEDEILFDIQSFLKDSTACENTLGLASPGGPKNPNGDGATVTEIRDHNNRLVFQAGCSIANLKDCIYGQATKSRILIRSLTIQKYNDPGPPWNNAGEKSTLSVELIKGASIESWETLSAADKNKFAGSAYGSVRISKKIRIKTGLNASGSIQYCVADDLNILSESCQYYQGIQSPTDLKCKNVTIETADTRPAIINTGNYLNENNSNALNALQIGTTPPGTIADGNTNVEGRTYIKRNIYTQNNFIFLNKALLVKDVPINGLTIHGASNAGIATLNFGNSGSGASITGSGNKIGIGITPGSTPASALEVNGDTTTQNSLLIKKNIKVAQSGLVGGYIDWSSDIQLTRNGATSLKFDGASISINSTYNTKTSNNPEYIATQDWVNEQFLTRLGDQAISGIFNQILNNNAADARVITLKRNLCNSIKNASWNGTQCLLFVNNLCASDEILKGWSNGNKVCVKRYPPTSKCSASLPPQSAQIGVNSNGTIRCANMQPYVDNGVAIVLSNLNICYAKYPPSSGYSSHSYNPTTKVCTAYGSSSNVSSKGGCGALWGVDSAGDCGCWGGWSYNGYYGCSYNWHTTGGQCKCIQTLVTTYTCTISGGWCW